MLEPEDLDRLAEITAEDVADAQRAWRHDAGAGVADLLDADAMDLRPRVEDVIEGKDRKHYLIDSDGVRWRVWDLMPPGKRSSSTKLRPVEPPHNWAEERAFVHEDGTQRRYSFKYREPRELRADLLAAQLSAARQRD